MLPFILEVVGHDLSNVTSHAGLPLVLEALRAVTPTRWYRRLRKALGYKHWRTVRRHLESLVLLVVGGGEHISDIDVLRADRGLARLLGFVPSSAERLKVFLYGFHQDRTGRRLEPEDDLELSVRGRATIRPEGPGLRLLAELNQEVVRVLQRDNQSLTATLDVDATLIEAWKKAALECYEGYPSYQPQMAWWAEQAAWVADEFRDGNVPAEYEGRAFLIRAFGALPGSVQRRRLRGDTALYNEDALTWADDQDIELSGLRGHERVAAGEGAGAAGLGLEPVPDLPPGRQG